MPGTAFGDSGEGFIRISYAYSLEDLKVAIGRLESFIIKLRNQKQAIANLKNRKAVRGGTDANIVLHEPEIPANTGNIGRTCVAAGARLHLIEPLGFRLTEKNLKRAGMDYWAQLDVRTYIDFEDFLDQNPGARIYMATTKAHQIYTEVHYEPDCYIMFGKESAGIPEEILVDYEDTCIRIPMIGEIRSTESW